MTEIIKKLIKTTYETFKWPPRIADSSSGFQINDPSDHTKVLATGTKIC